MTRGTAPAPRVRCFALRIGFAAQIAAQIMAMLVVALSPLSADAADADPAAAGEPVAAGDPVDRPNILLLIADDLGYGELGCQGNQQIPTPHLDRLAADGARFTSGYVTAPFCAASRAGLFTGRYQTRFGFELNPIGAVNCDPRVGLPASETTFAQRLHDAGYATGLVGKWHLGGTAAYHPQRRGFDEFFGFLHEGHTFVPPPTPGFVTWLRRKTLPDGSQGRWENFDRSIVLSTHMGHDEPPYDADNPILRGSQPVQETTHLTDACTREAVDFIRRHRDRPFLLAVAYNAVHSPMQADRERLERFAPIDDLHRRIFAAMLSHLDDSVGEVLGAIDAAGLRERTLVFFLSDNGGPTRELTSSNAPLRGSKGEVWEGGLRVPFLCRWTGTIAAGQVCDAPTISLDIAATSLAAAGMTAAGLPLDGINLLPALRPADMIAASGPIDAQRLAHDAAARSPQPVDSVGTASPRPLFWRVGPRAALRLGDWKIVRQPASGRGGRETPDWRLFRLSTDIAEAHDLAAEEPDRLRELREAWDRLNAEMIPPAW